MTLAAILEDFNDVRGHMLTVAIGGSCFYFVKGVLRRSSRGRRLASGVEEVITNGPRVCRSAAWFGVFLTIDSRMVGAHRHQCPLNMAVAWGAANALFSMHRGTDAAVREGLKGAAYGGVAWIVIYNIARYIDSMESC